MITTQVDFTIKSFFLYMGLKGRTHFNEKNYLIINEFTVVSSIFICNSFCGFVMCKKFFLDYLI